MLQFFSSQDQPSYESAFLLIEVKNWKRIFKIQFFFTFFNKNVISPSKMSDLVSSTRTILKVFLSNILKCLLVNIQRFFFWTLLIFVLFIPYFFFLLFLFFFLVLWSSSKCNEIYRWNNTHGKKILSSPKWVHNGRYEFAKKKKKEKCEQKSSISQPQQNISVNQSATRK